MVARPTSTSDAALAGATPGPEGASVRVRTPLGRAVALAAVVAVLAAVALGVFAAYAATSSEKNRIASFHGARLGMTSRDVRDRFEPAAPGRWQTVTEAGEVAMTWAAEAGPRRARFEFHAGMLVAVRASIDPRDSLSSGPSFDVSPAAVLQRVSPAADVVEITILARDCPTHAAEVKALLASRSAR